MVWAGITGSQRTALTFVQGNLNSQRYRNEILRPQVLPFMRRNPTVEKFQHDGAKPHTARICNQFLADNRISVLDWPSKSPDFSPIEHVWDRLKRQVRARQNPPRTLVQLLPALQEEWAAIPQQYLRALFNSMRRRLNACIRANGGHTGY